MYGIQNIHGGLWAGQGKWTTNPDEARLFDTYREAFNKRRIVARAFQVIELRMELKA